MGNDDRKHMRIALSAEDYKRFSAFKAKSEDERRLVMTDPQFALSLIRWAISERDE